MNAQIGLVQFTLLFASMLTLMLQTRTIMNRRVLRLI